MDQHRSRVAPRLAAALPTSVVAVFVVWPLLRILAEGVSPSAMGEVVRDGRIRGIVVFTMVQAVLSTFGAVALSLPAAWLVGRHDFAGRRLLTALWVGPFTLPTVVVGLAARELLPSGLRRGVVAIICAHVFFNIGIVTRTVGDAWARLNPRPEEAAATLGASPWQVFRLVTLPRLASSILSIAGLVFALCVTSFGVVLLLATPRQATIEVEIWRQTTQLLRLDRAGALAVLQMLLASAVLLGTGAVGSVVDLRQRAVESRIQIVGARIVPAILIGVATTLLTLVPIVLLVERSLRSPGHGHSGHSFQAFRSLAHVTRGSGLFDAPWNSVLVSIRIAVPAALLATVLGTAAAIAVSRRVGGRVVSAILGLPLAVSAVTLGFGFLIAFADDPVAWRSRPWIVPILQGVVAMPFVQRVVTPAVSRMDPRLGQVAATLGASPAVVWRKVFLPLLARPILAGGGIAAAVALGEFGATTFLARPGTTTLPVAVARLASRPGAVLQAQSMALAVILGVLTVTVTVVADLAGRESR